MRADYAEVNRLNMTKNKNKRNTTFGSEEMKLNKIHAIQGGAAITGTL